MGTRHRRGSIVPGRPTTVLHGALGAHCLVLSPKNRLDAPANPLTLSSWDRSPGTSSTITSRPPVDRPSAEDVMPLRPTSRTGLRGVTDRRTRARKSTKPSPQHPHQDQWRRLTTERPRSQLATIQARTFDISENRAVHPAATVGFGVASALPAPATSTPCAPSPTAGEDPAGLLPGQRGQEQPSCSPEQEGIGRFPPDETPRIPCLPRRRGASPDQPSLRPVLQW